MSEVRPEHPSRGRGGTAPLFCPPEGGMGLFVGPTPGRNPPAAGGPLPPTSAKPTAAPAGGADGGIVVAAPPRLKGAAAGGGKIQSEKEEGVGDGLYPYVLPGQEPCSCRTHCRARVHRSCRSPDAIAPSADRGLLRQTQLDRRVALHPAGTDVAINFDAPRLAVIGTAVPVFESSGFAAEGDGVYATSSNGSLVYLAGSATTSLVWLDGKGTSTTLGAGRPRSAIRDCRRTAHGSRSTVSVRPMSMSSTSPGRVHGCR